MNFQNNTIMGLILLSLCCFACKTTTFPTRSKYKCSDDPRDSLKPCITGEKVFGDVPKKKKPVFRAPSNRESILKYPDLKVYSHDFLKGKNFNQRYKEALRSKDFCSIAKKHTINLLNSLKKPAVRQKAESKLKAIEGILKKQRVYFRLLNKLTNAQDEKKRNNLFLLLLNEGEKCKLHQK